MIEIRFPEHNYKIRKEKGKEVIFDECRKQWVVLTPEEWVRQNFLQYLIKVMGYPASLISVEKEIYLGELKKRFDIAVYKDAKPWMIIECKEMKVPLTEAVIRQVLNYNIAMQVEFVVITNGKSTMAVQLQGREMQLLERLPVFVL